MSMHTIFVIKFHKTLICMNTHLTHFKLLNYNKFENCINIFFGTKESISSTNQHFQWLLLPPNDLNILSQTCLHYIFTLHIC